MGIVYGIIGLVLGGAAAWLFCRQKLGGEIEILEERANSLRNDLTARSHENKELCEKIAGLEAEGKSHRDLAILFPELVKQILSARSSSEATDYTMRAINRLTQTDRIAVFLADRMGKRLGLSGVRGLEDRLSAPLALNVGEGHVGHSAETGKVMTREDFENESALVKKQVEQTAIPGYVPDLVAPMTCQGVLYGIICLNDIPRTASLVPERLRAVANVSAAAFENIRLFERFETAADLDMDTGLPGPSQLQQKLEWELERFRRFSSPLSLVEVRVPTAASADRFLGREIMRMAATYLKNTMRNIDIGVKISADTVLLLLPGTDMEGSSNVVDRLGQAMPQLRDEEGDSVDAVELRFISLDPSEGNVTADDIMDRLGQKRFKRYGA